MAKDCPDINPLQHNGSSQEQRFLKALDPQNAPISELDSEQWMRFAFEYARQINYFTESDDQNPNGHWQDFFINEDEIKVFLAKAEETASTTPHLTLFVCFLRLLENSRQHLNSITGKHLDFYYKEVLQLKKQAPTPDSVHLVFELAKNAAEQQIKTGKQFNGGKDEQGNLRWYEAEEELIVNAAKIQSLQSIYHQNEASKKNIYTAPMVNSADGLGAEFETDNPRWYPFGSPNHPAAMLGFALASPVLHLKEGSRTIVAHLDLISKTDLSLIQNQLLQHIQIFLSGEKEWLGPFRPVASDPSGEKTLTQFTNPSDENYRLSIGIQLSAEDEKIVAYNAEVHGLHFNTKHPVMRVLLAPEQANIPGSYSIYSTLNKTKLNASTIEVEVSGMKEVILENDLGPLDPSKSFLPFGPQPIVGSHFFVGNPEIFSKDWSEVSLNINWQDVPADLRDHYKAYQNNFIRDLSKVNYASYVEGTSVPDGIFNKVVPLGPIDDLNKDSIESYFPVSMAIGPTDLKVYGKSTQIVTNNDYFTAAVELLDQKAWLPVTEKESVPLFKYETNQSTDQITQVTIPKIPLQTKTTKDSIYLNDINSKHYHTRKALIESYLYTEQERKAIFDNALFAATDTNPESSNNALSAATKQGFIRLKLNRHFFHKIYPQLYAVAISKEEKTNALIPNEPYTPQIEAIEISYKAKAVNPFLFSDGQKEDKLLNYEARKVQLFHDTPLGQQEQHLFLKDQYTFTEKRLHPLPQIEQGGALYIGLSEVKTLSTLSLLIQVAEGSEDPLAPTFEGDDGVEWAILCSNEWKTLGSDYKIADTTNDFLTSGIVKFLIPSEATQQNTILAPGLLWLRASIKSPYIYSSVCQIIGMHTQVVPAVFDNQGNELSHLSTALPAETISKMRERQALIKKISQPYSSFGGAPEESDAAFYLRISQRLRHKNRVVMIWDYEQLVLQAFPSIFKAKCLNHTATVDPTVINPIDPRKNGSELAPGFVTVIVIPDIRNKNAYDQLKPRVSKNILTKIEDFLRGKTSLHVECNVANPDYESIRLKFDVVFRTGFDPNFYTKELDKALINYLSPWAGNKEANIQLGGTMHRSLLINFIEKQASVDYVAKFEMKHFKANEDDMNRKLFDDKDPQRKITASNSKAILGSAPSHIITAIKSTKCSR